MKYTLAYERASVETHTQKHSNAITEIKRDKHISNEMNVQGDYCKPEHWKQPFETKLKEQGRSQLCACTQAHAWPPSVISVFIKSWHSERPQIPRCEGRLKKWPKTNNNQTQFTHSHLNRVITFPLRKRCGLRGGIGYLDAYCAEMWPAGRRIKYICKFS